MFRQSLLCAALMFTGSGCDVLGGKGGGGSGGGGGGGGEGAESAADSGAGSSTDDLTSAPLYAWALASCEHLEECCTDCDGPYGWGPEIATLEDCIEFSLGFGVVYVDDELVPGCPGPDYDALVSCIEGLSCDESVTFDCPESDEDIVPCE